MQKAKEEFRQALLAKEQSEKRDIADRIADFRKAAEKIRGLPVYRTARNVLVSPEPDLLQVRLNVLADRKYLTLPTAGLQKGFLFLDPEVVPPKKRIAVMRSNKETPYAKRVPFGEGIPHPVDLIVSGALAVGEDGSRIGDGLGHLDLQCAIVTSLGWISPDAQIVAVVEEDRIFPSVPTEDTDVGIHWIITSRELREAPRKEPAKSAIVWERLSMKQIRRNDALFYLHRHLQAP
ncbi:MAG: 5-formyltetrahydrofolate cyclo-ligase [Syntrophobacteraceae bacterium]